MGKRKTLGDEIERLKVEVEGYKQENDLLHKGAEGLRIELARFVAYLDNIHGAVHQAEARIARKEGE